MADYQVSLLGPSFNLIGVLFPVTDAINLESITWRRSWRGVGTCELKIRRESPFLSDLLTQGNYIYITRDGLYEAIYLIYVTEAELGIVHYEQGTPDHANAVYAGGQGEGTARNLVLRTDAAGIAALGRMEAFLDARDIPLADYAALANRADAELKQRAIVTSNVITAGEPAKEEFATVRGVSPAIYLQTRLALPPPAIPFGENDRISITSAAYDTRTGPTNQVMLDYVQAHVVAPADPARAVPNFTVAGIDPEPMTITYNARFQTILDIMKEIGLISGCGFDIVLTTNDKLEWRCTPLADHTTTSIAPVVFADGEVLLDITGRAYRKQWDVGSLITVRLDALGGQERNLTILEVTITLAAGKADVVSVALDTLQGASSPLIQLGRQLDHRATAYSALTRAEAASAAASFPLLGIGGRHNILSPAHQDSLPMAANSGDVLTWDGSQWKPSPPTGGGGGHIIQANGVPFTQRGKLNFIDADETLVTDDGGNDRSNVTFSNFVRSLGRSGGQIARGGLIAGETFTLRANASSSLLGTLILREAGSASSPHAEFNDGATGDAFMRLENRIGVGIDPLATSVLRVGIPSIGTSLSTQSIFTGTKAALANAETFNANTANTGLNAVTFTGLTQSIWYMPVQYSASGGGTFSDVSAVRLALGSALTALVATLALLCLPDIGTATPGSITNLVGLDIGAITHGSAPTNVYGIRIGNRGGLDPIGGGTAHFGESASGTVRGISQEDTTAFMKDGYPNVILHNVFAADTLFGSVATPAALLEVAGSRRIAAVGASDRLVRIGGTLVEAASGTHPLMAGLEIIAPTVTNNAASVTDAATVYINGAPTGTFSNAPWGLFVDGANAYVNGDIRIGANANIEDSGGVDRITLRNAPSATQGHIEFTGSQIKLNTGAAVIYDSGGNARIRVGQTGAGNAYTSILHSAATLGNFNAVLYIARGDTTGSDVAGIETAISPTFNASVGTVRLLDVSGTLTNTGFSVANFHGLRFAPGFTGGTWTNATAVFAGPITSGSPQFGTLRFFWGDRPTFGYAVAAGSTTVIGMDLEGLGLANWANAFGIRVGLSSLASSVNVGLFLDDAVTPALPTLTGNYSILSENTADSVLAGHLLIGANAAPTAGITLDVRGDTQLGAIAGADRVGIGVAPSATWRVNIAGPQSVADNQGALQVGMAGTLTGNIATRRGLAVSGNPDFAGFNITTDYIGLDMTRFSGGTQSGTATVTSWAAIATAVDVGGGSGATTVTDSAALRVDQPTSDSGIAVMTTHRGIRIKNQALAQVGGAGIIQTGIALDIEAQSGGAVASYTVRALGSAPSIHQPAMLIGANAAPVTSAGLEIQSTTLAFLLSRMTGVQRNALTAVDGMLLYNNDAAVARMQARENGSWESLSFEKQTEIDFGATPVESATFTIVDAAITTGTRIVAKVAYEAPTGKDLDEVEMDQLELLCGPGAGQFTLFARGMEGYVHDKFLINYVAA